MKKIISLLIAITMVIACVPTNIFAVENSQTFTYLGYIIKYSITNEWENNQNVSITVKNTGSEPIENWMLLYDFCGEINGIWNAVVETDNNGNKYIKNAGYNNVIEAGGAVNFGYTLNNAEGMPEEMTFA